MTSGAPRITPSPSGMPMSLGGTPASTVAEILRSGARSLEGHSDSPRLDAD